MYLDIFWHVHGDTRRRSPKWTKIVTTCTRRIPTCTRYIYRRLTKNTEDYWALTKNSIWIRKFPTSQLNITALYPNAHSLYPKAHILCPKANICRETLDLLWFSFQTCTLKRWWTRSVNTSSAKRLTTLSLSPSPSLLSLSPIPLSYPPLSSPPLSLSHMKPDTRNHPHYSIQQNTKRDWNIRRRVGVISIPLFVFRLIKCSLQTRVLLNRVAWCRTLPFLKWLSWNVLKIHQFHQKQSA